MKNIHLIARFKIREGKLRDFKDGVDSCIAVVKNEPGTMLYDWFIDEENLECTVVETYKDSDATLAHAANVNELLQKLMEIADFSAEVFGNTTEELKGALAGMNIGTVPLYRGL